MARYMVAENAIDQLTWILGPDAPMRMEMSTVSDLCPITFADLNQEQGMIIPLFNPKASLDFNESLTMIKKYFQYPKYHSPLIANLFLFTTEHWKQKDQDKLLEPDVIKNLQSKATKMIQYGSQEIGDEIGIEYLNQLIDTLDYMHSLKKRKVNLTCTALVESQHSVLFEKSLIKKLVGQYKEVMVEAAGDAIYAEMMTGFLLYNIVHHQKKFLFQSFNLIHRRCLFILKKACGIGKSTRFTKCNDQKVN